MGFVVFLILSTDFDSTCVYHAAIRVLAQTLTWLSE